MVIKRGSTFTCSTLTKSKSDQYDAYIMICYMFQIKKCHEVDFTGRRRGHPEHEPLIDIEVALNRRLSAGPAQSLGHLGVAGERHRAHPFPVGLCQ